MLHYAYKKDITLTTLVESSAGVEPSPAVELQRYIVRHPPPPKTNVNNVEVQDISGSQIAHEQHQALLPPDPNMAS